MCAPSSSLFARANGAAGAGRSQVQDLHELLWNHEVGKSLPTENGPAWSTPWPILLLPLALPFSQQTQSGTVKTRSGFTLHRMPMLSLHSFCIMHTSILIYYQSTWTQGREVVWNRKVPHPHCRSDKFTVGIPRADYSQGQISGTNSSVKQEDFLRAMTQSTAPA